MRVAALVINVRKCKDRLVFLFITQRSIHFCPEWYTVVVTCTSHNPVVVIVLVRLVVLRRLCYAVRIRARVGIKSGIRCDVHVVYPGTGHCFRLLLPVVAFVFFRGTPAILLGRKRTRMGIKRGLVRWVAWL